MRWVGIVVSCIIAMAIFWLAFFVLAPLVANTIPPSSWKGFLDFVVYALIAYCGGIGLPLYIGIAGIALSLKL